MEQKNSSNYNDFSPPTDVTRKPSRFSNLDSIKQYLSQKPPKKRLIIISGASLLILALGVGALKFFGPTAAEPNPVPDLVSNYAPEPTTTASPLTGVQVSFDLAKRPVTGIMIENSIDARPQAGLADAGVVFEAIAEGGITRFLALFQESRPELIGPIRSARPYYVQWVDGFDAAYVHSGGSGEGLALIRSLGVKDLDHANNPTFFDRVSNRYAPHNVYTSMDRLDKLKKEKGFKTSDFEPFERIDTQKADLTKSVKSTKLKKATSISFEISGPLYNTSYKYDSESNSYARKLAGQKHSDEKTGKQIKPSVVIALFTTYGYHSDGVHSKYTVIGSGKVLVFQNGTVTEGKWSKKSASSNIKFLDKSGKALLLQPGQTWITAIPEGRVAYTP